MGTANGVYASHLYRDNYRQFINMEEEPTASLSDRSFGNRCNRYARWYLVNTTKSQHINQLVLHNISLIWKNSVKYFGVTIDRRLNLLTHTNNTIKKISQIRGILHPALNSKSPIPPKISLSLLKLYINPVLTYAGAAWTPFIKRDNWKIIEAVQIKYIRKISLIPPLRPQRNISKIY